MSSTTNNNNNNNKSPPATGVMLRPSRAGAAAAAAEADTSVSASAHQQQLHAKMRHLVAEATREAARQQTLHPETYVDEAGQTLPCLTEIPDGWKDWLRLNISRKCSTPAMMDMMQKHGIAKSAALKLIQEYSSASASASGASAAMTPAQEVVVQAQAQQQTPRATSNGPPVAAPYAAINEDFTKRKAKWTLELLNFMDEMDTRTRMITELKRYPTLTEFREEFAAASRPLVVRANPKGWPINEWTFDALLHEFGNEKIQVQTGRATDPKFEENSGSHRTFMSMQDFIGKLRTGPPNDVYMTANNAAQNRELMNKLLGRLPNLGDASEPWLDLPRMTSSGYLWIGNKGTATPNHHDNTNNGFVQITGHKRWRMAPAWAMTNMYNHNFVFSYVDPAKKDAAKYPLAEKVRWIEFVLGPGDFLFIPQGWWHTVESLDENVSVSFTCWKSCITHFPFSV